MPSGLSQQMILSLVKLASCFRQVPGATKELLKGRQNEPRTWETRKEQLRGGRRGPYSFTSTHPGLWRRTSMRVFMSVVLKRINVLCSLQHKTAKDMLRTLTFLGCPQGSGQRGGRKARFYRQMPQPEVLHLSARYHSLPTFRLAKIRLLASLSY